MEGTNCLRNAHVCIFPVLLIYYISQTTDGHISAFPTGESQSLSYGLTVPFFLFLCFFVSFFFWIMAESTLSIVIENPFDLLSVIYITDQIPVLQTSMYTSLQKTMQII